MLKKLKLKFIIISTLSMMLVLVIVLGSVNVITYTNAVSDIYATLEFVSERSERELSEKALLEWQKKKITPETQYETRYIIVDIDENGELAYKYGVILNYLFSVDKLEMILNNKLPIHVVEKKIPYMDENGKLIKPDKPNGHKFETLVLDMVHMQDSCLAYEVDRRKEFAPVKNATGVDSVESARELLAENGVEL